MSTLLSPRSVLRRGLLAIGLLSLTLALPLRLPVVLAGKKLDVIDADLDGIALLAGIIFPFTLDELAVDSDLAALAAIAADHFGGLTERNGGEPVGILDRLAGSILAVIVYGKAHVGDACAGSPELDVRIGSQIADEHNSVKH